jgi:alcohol dehydrogenase class IV
MLLPEVTKFSLHAALPRYAEAARLSGMAHRDDADQVAGAKLLDGLVVLNDELGVPTPAAFGINRDDWYAKMPQMAAQALASGSPNNNPRIPNTEEILTIYANLYPG